MNMEMNEVKVRMHLGGLGLSWLFRDCAFPSCRFSIIVPVRISSVVVCHWVCTAKMGTRTRRIEAYIMKMSEVYEIENKWDSRDIRNFCRLKCELDGKFQRWKFEYS